jgi:ribosomal protein L37AE/L43A
VFGHSCNCLGKYVERLRGADKTVEKFPCPTRHSKFTLKSDQDVTELASNDFIKNMLEIMAIQEKAKASTACSRCKGPAVNLCTSCKILMCQECSESHDNWFTMKIHNVLSVQELKVFMKRLKIFSEIVLIL